MSINPMGDSTGDLTTLARPEDDAVVVGERYDKEPSAAIPEPPATESPPVSKESRSSSRECLTLFGTDC